MIFRVRRSFCIQLLQTKIRSFAFIKPRAHNKMFAHRRISTVCSCTFPKQIELFFSLIISYSPALHKQNIPGYNKKAPTNVSAFSLEVTPGFEPGNQGFADPRLTTWLCHHFEKDALTSASFSFGADDEARTRYLHLGKVALYQMSYIRILGASGRNRTNDTRIFSPLLYRLSYRGICGDPERARTVDL